MDASHKPLSDRQATPHGVHMQHAKARHIQYGKTCRCEFLVGMRANLEVCGLRLGRLCVRLMPRGLRRSGVGGSPELRGRRVCFRQLRRTPRERLVNLLARCLELGGLQDATSIASQSAAVNPACAAPDTINQCI